jgi:hypothetical protein
MAKDYASLMTALRNLLGQFDEEDKNDEGVPSKSYSTEDLANGGQDVPTNLEPEVDSAQESAAGDQKKKRKINMMAGILSKSWNK